MFNHDNIYRQPFQSSWAQNNRLAAGTEQFTGHGLLKPSAPPQFFRVNLKHRSRLDLKLIGLKSNADLALLGSAKKLIQQSRRPGSKNETIQANLNEGTYFVRVSLHKNAPKTSYQLKFLITDLTSQSPNPSNPSQPGSDSNQNTPPRIELNSGLGIPISGAALAGRKTITLDSDALKAYDSEQLSANLTYTLTRAPQQGTLKLNGVPLGAGSSFTQFDIDSDRLSYTFSGGLTTQVTDDGVDNTDAQISLLGNNVSIAYSASVSAAPEVFLYNGATGTTQQITANSTTDTVKAVFGNKVVWTGWDGNSTELFLYNGDTGITRKLTDGSTASYSLSNVLNSNAGVFYDQYPSGFFDDGSTNVRVAYAAHNPRLDGAYAVWDSYEDIFFYNHNTRQTRNLTNNTAPGIYASHPSVSGNSVVWQGWDGNDFEIFLWNGRTTIQLTNNFTDDRSPLISGSSVAWVGKDPAGTDNEVFLYNPASGTKQLSADDASPTNVQLSGSNLMWQSDVNTYYYNLQTGALRSLPIRAELKLAGSKAMWTESDGQDKEIYLVDLATASLSAGDSFDFSVSDGKTSTSSTFNISIG